MATTHQGECFCGAVHLEVSGEPEAMGYCHCASCRSWSGGPVNAFSLWKPDAVRITSGAENVGMFQKTEVSQRQYCKKCGGHQFYERLMPPPAGTFTSGAKDQRKSRTSTTCWKSRTSSHKQPSEPTPTLSLRRFCMTRLKIKTSRRN